ncbi:HlyD family efflux transporter periplasmic adaptor subunit [Desulfococcaceae bacterium HSG8]|nr:HlyD family efflux transporter periplasmic adaptor subunit [Desulfococcaceae bacterium HSG8]
MNDNLLKMKAGTRIPPAGAGTMPSRNPSQPSREMVLARFIRLCSSVLSTPVSQEAAALIVNRISELVRVDRAVLVRLKGKNAILSVTGGGAAAQDSSFADAVDAVRRQYRERQDPVIVPGTGDEGKAENRVSSAHLRRVQGAMGGTNILWVPLWLDREAAMPPAHALWLERWQGLTWERGDIELLQHAALFLGHGMVRQRTMIRSGRRIIQVAVLLLLMFFLALPVTSSVTGPMQVVPDRPHHIFAPMDGILKELLVQPGQWVENEAILFRYDSRVLDKRLDEAYRSVAVARAKLIRLEGAAHRDREARAELPVQQLEVERAEANVGFFAKQQARAEVRSAKAGVIVLDDPDALVGAALQTGQIVLSVADPSRNKLHIMVPSGDVGFLKEGARVKVRLDSDPLRSFPAVITRIGFEVRLSENQVPSVLVEAVWSGKIPKVQPGQKGSAKIFGESTRMGMQILRKPLIGLRSFIGF